MKFALTADIHLSRYGQDKVEEDGLPERLHSIKETLYNMADYCLNHDVHYIVISGDIIHTKSLIYTIAQELMLNYINHFNMEFIIIDGNHDLSGKGKTAISALRFIMASEAVWVSQVPQVLPVNKDVLCIPYSYDVVNQVKTNSSKILISHFGLSEGILNSGISIISDISINNLVGKYELVLLGHYHKPQEIIRDDIRVYYVGSPIQLDWGEKGEEKRFLIVDTDTLDVQSIPTVGYKKHIEFEIDSQNKTAILEEATKAQEAGHHIKILKTENMTLESDQFRIIDKTERDITNRGIDSSMSEEDKLRQYLNIREIPEEEHDEYLKEGLEIIQECEEI